MEMNQLQSYLNAVPAELVWTYFFAHGCGHCPAKTACDSAPEGTCCKENFFAWANGGDAPCT